MTAISFKAATRSRLLKAIESDDITCEIDLSGWAQFNRATPFYAMLLGSERSEIILVTGGTGGVLTIERGQEGTTGLNWPKQTLIFQQLTAETFSQVEQLETFRQGAYNPNGALQSLYFGEKFYQSDDALWWKAIAQGSTEWRLIAGEIFAEDPEFVPPPGTWEDGQSLEMRTFYSGANIRYTDDGTEPTEDSALYTEPFVMPTGTSVYKAKNFGGERWEQEGSIVSGTYFLDVGTRAWAFAGDSKTGCGEGSDLEVFGGKLYGLSIQGYLLQYDHVLDRWDIVANPPGAPFTGDNGRHLWMDGTTLYMGAVGGDWYYWNGTDAWVAVYTGGSFFYPPRPVWFNGTWYAVFETGLHHWGGSSWVSDGYPGAGTIPVGYLAVYDGDLYWGLTIADAGENGKMYRFDNPGFTQVAAPYSPDPGPADIWVKDNEIYAVSTGNSYSYILQWNKSDAWTLRATADYAYYFSANLRSCVVYNTRFFCDLAGRLYYWNQIDTTFKRVAELMSGYYGPLAAFTAPDRSEEEVYMISSYVVGDNNRLLRWQ